MKLQGPARLRHFKQGTSNSRTIWVGEGAEKAESGARTVCDTVTNRRDTLVGSCLCARHGTLTDGCWNGSTTQPPLPVSSPAFLSRFGDNSLRLPFLPLTLPFALFSNVNTESTTLVLCAASTFPVFCLLPSSGLLEEDNCRWFHAVQWSKPASPPCLRLSVRAVADAAGQGSP